MPVTTYPVGDGVSPVTAYVHVIRLLTEAAEYTATTERYYRQLPEAYQDRLDAPADWPLRRFIGLLGDQMHDIIETRAAAAESTLASYENVRYDALGWLTGLTGVLLPVNPAASQRRMLPQSVSHHTVGSVGWIVERIQSHLGGTKYVNLVPHDLTARSLRFAAFGYDDPATGYDDPGFGFDDGPTPTPGVWQIRVEILPTEAPADLDLMIQPYCPAGFRFIVQDVTSLPFAYDDALIGWDDINFKLDA